MSITPQGGPGIKLGLGGLVANNNQITLAAGQQYVIPAGQWMVNTGIYTLLEVKDPITGLWWLASENVAGGVNFVTSDGGNFRLANLTGCAIGAVITNVGSGYTSAPTVTASAGGSTWQAIVGGAVNTSVTITTAGAGYNYAPQLIVQGPPAGGIACTMTCTISGGAINAVTVVNQGAGYTSAPTVTVVPDPREASASTQGPTTPAVLTTALTGAGTITGLLCTNHGTPQTSVPTLTFTGGGGSSAAATAVMCFTATGYTVTTAGVAYGNAQPFAIQTMGGIVSASPAITNPFLQQNLLIPRQALIAGTSTAGGAIQTGGVIIDGGLFSAVPTAVVIPGNSVPTTQGVAAITVGGVTDTSLLQPII